MASLSLPRVLQLKKNSLDAEREHFEKFQTLAIQKAINSIETPVKEKHVRSTIIGTFQEQSAITYWMVAIRLPLQDNRIVAWKFCHVTHKLLREGHPACLDDSQRHINMIENLGKLWVHLREGYGRLVNLYCNLLVCKLKFHSHNPRFPGNMQLTADELDAIAENDVNNYFQLCVELFDYMDDILTLQAAVFDSLGNARANSMTASGQCRLAALIPCAQDSSQIYDCNVRLLFRLHAALPADTLAGHRERFRQQFKKLSSFYKHASSLQYYRNLLTLPLLPSNPPNFLIQSDFGTYVTPVVSVPEPPPDEVDAVGSLIDTSDLVSQATTPEQLDGFDTRTTPSPQPDPVVERDRLIDHLQNELKRLRSEVTQLVQERHTMVDSMRGHCTRLETQLQATKTELEEEKQKAELLSVETPEIKQKLTATEDRAKVTDEKFQKLKGAYTQLREEHIHLIRQKAEVDKTAATLRASAAQHESAKMALQQQINDRIKDVELLQQSASSSEEIETYKNEITNLRSELEQSRQKEVELETIRASMEALEIEYKTSTKEQQEKLTTVANELKDVMENLEIVKKEKVEREVELSRVKEELEGVRAKSGDEFKKIVQEKQAALAQVADLTKQHQQEKQEQSLYIKDLQAELENLQHKLTNTENNFMLQLTEVSEDLKTKDRELNDILNAKDAEINEALEKITVFESEFKDTDINYKKEIDDKSKEINALQININELLNLKKTNVALISQLEAEKGSIQQELNQATEEKIKLMDILTAKETELLKLADKVKELTDTMNINSEQLENNKNLEISSLKETLQTTIVEKDSIIRELHKEYHYETLLLKDKLQNVMQCKDEITHDLKDMIVEKDAQVISLNVEVNKLSAEVSRLEEELKETHAELEIGRNELLSLRDEHEAIIERRDTNLAMKNDELRRLHEEVNKLTEENNELKSQKDNVSKLLAELATEKQILESDLKKSVEEHKNLIAFQEKVQLANEEVIIILSNEIGMLKEQNEKLEMSKNNDVRTLNEKITQESAYIAEIAEKEEIIAKTKEDYGNLEKLRMKEKEDVGYILSEKDKEKQMLEVRLDHTERERLNAECELQDLLQHNTVLEADLAVLRKHLEEAQKEIEKQRTRILECVGQAAVEVTSEALAAVERANAHDTSRAAAELATKALHQLSRHTETNGNEETLARSAIFAAHSTAQLSAYVAEMSNTSTNMELSDKLNSECRTMLQATKQCLESLGSGVMDGSTCDSARASVDNVAKSAAAATRLASGERNVDDELADMDLAIEQAASQIEEMLAASRAGDSGVKLEVNEKILDACTTLMGAVKILVQDARKLQNELGDPKTRQKMYRKNPQWSEGLISAAKAVVFAAKLLLSSADEAVGAAGRVEGVSAAAHEVAGSTAQLVAASRARAPPQAPALARLTQASRGVAAATGAVVAAVRAASARVHEQEALDTSALTLTATRRLEMESKVRSLELESALDAERARLAALRKRHYHLAQLEENGNMTNGKE